MSKNRFIFYLLWLVFSISCKNNEPQKLQIATSSNLQHAIKEITTYFEAGKNTPCNIIIGSSGKLTSQIENSAPFDVFLSADKKYTDYLISKKNSFNRSTTFAYGKIVLASKTIPANQLLLSLTTNKFQKLGIPNPKFAPYGEMALEFLQEKKLDQKVKNKLVFGESVMQTNQFLFTNNLDLAFTSLSTVITNKNVNWVIINEKMYTPKAHVALNVSKKNQELSSAFIDFLKTEKAQLILKKYGYGTAQ